MHIEASKIQSVSITKQDMPKKKWMCRVSLAVMSLWVIASVWLESQQLKISGVIAVASSSSPSSSSVVVMDTTMPVVTAKPHHDKRSPNNPNHTPTANNNTATGSPTGSPFAYVFMAFGCDPENRDDHQGIQQTHNPGYRPYLANMLAATHILRQHGSTADVVAIFKFQHPRGHLPPQEEVMLKALNIKIRYIPHDDNPAWQQAEKKHFLVGVLNKIHILNLTEYRRVLFLDGDVLPLANLDYMMEMSDNIHDDDGEHQWQETVVLSTSRVPMNAGLFVAAPNATLYRQVHALVQDKIVRDQVRRQNFDTVHGWGHAFVTIVDGGDGDGEESLLWQSNRDNGTLWNYHGANSDQGIFYFYPKYLRRSLTQILADQILHFGPSSNQQKDTTVLFRRDVIVSGPDQHDNPIQRYKDRYPEKYNNTYHHHHGQLYYTYDFEVPNCLRWINYNPVGCLPPYSDHAHFTHPIPKPWQLQPAPLPTLSLRAPGNASSASAVSLTSAFDLWWQTLYDLQELHPGIIQLELLLPDYNHTSGTPQ